MKRLAILLMSFFLIGTGIALAQDAGTKQSAKEARQAAKEARQKAKEAEKAAEEAEQKAMWEEA